MNPHCVCWEDSSGECTAACSSGGGHGLFSRVRPQTHTRSPHTPPALRGLRARLSRARRGGELKTPADAPAAPVRGPGRRAASCRRERAQTAAARSASKQTLDTGAASKDAFLWGVWLSVSHAIQTIHSLVTRCAYRIVGDRARQRDLWGWKVSFPERSFKSANRNLAGF